MVAFGAQQAPAAPAARSGRQQSSCKPAQAPQSAASWSARSKQELLQLLAAESDLAIKHRAAHRERQQRVDQLLAEAAELNAAMDVRAQQWGRQWRGLQGEVDVLHHPPPEAAIEAAAEAAAAAAEAKQSWVGPLVAAWAFLATGQQRMPEQQAGWLADWLAAHVLPVGMLRALTSAWARLIGPPPAQQR
ncbi:hypothetical protein ABPG75_011554 [Micractinium tetrahymenae]